DKRQIYGNIVLHNIPLCCRSSFCQNPLSLSRPDSASANITPHTRMCALREGWWMPPPLLLCLCFQLSSSSSSSLSLSVETYSSRRFAAETFAATKPSSIFLLHPSLPLRPSPEP